MKHTVLLVFALLAPSVTGASPVQENVLQTAVEKAMPCVVKLYGAGISREHGDAVGVIASSDGLVVTASGLLLDASNLRAVLADGRTVKATVQRALQELVNRKLRLDFLEQLFRAHRIVLGQQYHY